MILGGPAFALEITEETTEPVATSTADDGVAGDVEITSDGSIILAEGSTTAAITLDSDNNVTVDGTIEASNTDSIQALLLEGGNTASVSVSGNIGLIEDSLREDTDSDGDLDGDYASGSDRVAILVNGGAALTSDIVIENTASIAVVGNESAAILLSAELQGNIDSAGDIGLVGSNTVAIGVDESLSGDLSQRGSINLIGENAIGINVDAEIDGALSNSGDITSTGFASVAISNYLDPSLVTEDTLALEDRIDADELLAGGSAIEVTASIRDGFLNNGLIDFFIDETELADETKDTVEDFDENRGTGGLQVYGSAPTLSISAEVDGSMDDLVIGLVSEDVRDTLDDDADGDTQEILMTFDYDYGLINRGSIASNGLNEGFSSTGIQVQGAADGSRSVIVSGGIFNSGTVTANALEAAAVAIDLGDYTQVPTLINQGAISTYSESTIETSSVAIQVAENSSLSEILNTGSIAASSFGDDVSAIAIQDASGTLLSIINRGTISTSNTARDGLNTASAIAIDLSGHQASESAVFLQERTTPVDDTNGDDVIDESDVSTPIIIGDILFGAGDDLADFQAGGFVSTLFDFGEGTDELRLSGGVSGIGGIANLEVLSLDASSLELSNLDAIALESLNIENESSLSITLDLANADPNIAKLQVQGNVVIDDTSSVITEFIGFEGDSFELLLIDAADIDLTGDVDVALNLDLPAIYSEEIILTDTQLSVAFDTKSAAELGLPDSYSTIFDGLLELAQELDSVGTQLTDYTDEATLVEAFDQLLPDMSQMTVNFLSSQLDLSTSLTGNRLEHIDKEGAGQWFQYTIGRGAQQTNATKLSYSGTETNFSMGFDQAIMDNLYAGVSLSLRTSDYLIDKVADHNLRSTSYDLGLYSSYRLGPFDFDNSITFGLVDQYSDRLVNFGEETELYEGKWGGSYFGGSSLLSVQKNFGDYFIRPSVSLDYFSISEDDYQETINSDTGGLALGVNGVDTTKIASTIKLSFGLENWFNQETQSESFGDSKQFYIGYRADISSDDYASQANFLSGSGAEFDIANDLGDQAGIIFGANITLLSQDQNSFTVGYAGEQIDDFTRHSFQAELRIGF